MLVLLPTLIALSGAAVGFVVAYRLRRSVGFVRRSIVPHTAAATTAVVVRGVRFRMLGAVGVAAFVGLAVLPLRISDIPLGTIIAPGVGAAVGLVVLALSPFPRRVPDFGIRQAELTPRTVGAFGPRWGFTLPSTAVVALLALLVVTGVSSSTIDGVFSHEFTVVLPHAGTNTAGPYPGWSYGIPILAACALLIAAMLFALHRIAAAPRIGHRDASGLDSKLRATLTRFIMLAGTAVVVLYLGAVTLAAASAARSASQWAYLKPSYWAHVCGQQATCSFAATPADLVRGVVQPSYTLGAVGSVVGIVLIGVAFVLALLALTNLVIRWSVATPNARETIDA